MTHPTSPQDQFPRSQKLSPAAAKCLAELKNELDLWPGWHQSLSTSVVIELLCWYWTEVRREGKTEVSPRTFRPQTRRAGHQAGMNVYQNVRSSNMRKAAGLSKTEARLGPKPPKP